MASEWVPVVLFMAAIAAGINYSASGYIKNIRRHIDGDAAPMDWGKMGRAVLYGVVLGIAGIVLLAQGGHHIPEGADDVITALGNLSTDNNASLTAISAFVGLVFTFTGIIATADKYLGGRAKPGGKGGDVPPTKFDNNLPPPKGDAA